jgi:CheY-like chemotaxis protein
MTRRASATAAPQLRVLVAEDDYPWQFTIVRLVEALGVVCVAVGDGLAGAALLEDLSQSIDLAITDFRMPRGSGWRVVEAARKYRGIRSSAAPASACRIGPLVRSRKERVKNYGALCGRICACCTQRQSRGV